MLPIRLRDFVEDPDGWLYAVSTYDNEKDVGCLLRYVPDKEGGRPAHPASGTENTILRTRTGRSHTKNRHTRGWSSAFLSAICAGY